MIVIPDFHGLLLENFLHIVFIVAAAEILMKKWTAFVQEQKMITVDGKQDRTMWHSLIKYFLIINMWKKHSSQSKPLKVSCTFLWGATEKGGEGGTPTPSNPLTLDL